MGKKRRPAPAAGSPNYDKAVERAFRRLGLPDGRTYLGWRTAAAQKVGEAAVDQFDELFDSGSTTPEGTSAVAEWCASDFERARHLYSGWYSDAFLAQARWLASQLGPRLSGHADPLIVEVGSGMGTVAAVLGAALRVQVLAVDPMPGTSECARRFAELTGAQVEAHEATASDLLGLLDGRSPSAIYGIGVLRYLQKHTHQERDTYSFITALDAARREVTPTPQLSALLQGAGGADVFALEVTCPDWLTELDAAAKPMGYHLEMPKPGRLPVVVTGDPKVMATIALTSGHGAVPAADLLDGYSGYEALTEVRRLEGPAAEAARIRRGHVGLLEAAEVSFPDGTLRLEAAGTGTDWWVYQSSTNGYRDLTAAGSPEEATTRLKGLLARHEGSGAQARPLETPASMWR